MLIVVMTRSPGLWRIAPWLVERNMIPDDVLLKSSYLCVAINYMNNLKLDLNLLVTFEALLAERNVSRAAARLGLSQPAVSTQLARLRDVFGDRLFVPAHRGVVATARALELQAPLRAALDEVRGVVMSGRPFDAARAELTIRIAASDYAQSAVLAPFSIALRARAPGIRIAALPIDGRTLARQTEEGDVDLALMTPSTAPEKLRHRHLLDETYVCIARRGHPRIAGRLNLKAFVALEHLIVSPRGGGFWGPTDDSLAALGHRRRVVLSVSSFLVVPMIVAGSDLIALVPSRVASGSDRALQILRPPIDVEGFSLALVWHERTHDHAAHRWIRDALGDWAKSGAKPRVAVTRHRQA
jgi:DNA-binding transcriptional LysR family regulator